MKPMKLPTSILVAFLATSSGACSVPLPEEDEPEITDGDVSEEPEAVGESREAFVTCSRYAYCGPGYIASVHCSLQCGSCPYGRYGSIPNATECIYNLPWGNITAQPAQVAIPSGSLGTTSVCASSNVLNSQVWVSMDGGPETLFASHSTSGCSSAPWIQIGHSYDFRLYAGSAHSTLFDSVTVTGVVAGAPEEPADPCDSCRSGTSCRCGDGVCRPNTQQCP